MVLRPLAAVTTVFLDGTGCIRFSGKARIVILRSNSFAPKPNVELFPKDWAIAAGRRSWLIICLQSRIDIHCGHCFSDPVGCLADFISRLALSGLERALRLVPSV